MTQPAQQNWLPLALIAAALVIWGLFIALGVYLEPSADEPRYDPRKALIVVACIAAFVLFWGVALALRNRRKRSK